MPPGVAPIEVPRLKSGGRAAQHHQQRPAAAKDEPRKKFDVGLKKTTREDKAAAAKASFDKPQLKKAEKVEKGPAESARIEGHSLKHVEQDKKSAFEVITRSKGQ